jgi:hypothetical protein
MLHPVIARKAFEDVGINITANTYLPEGSLQAALVEKLLMREARWLRKNRSGELVGYDPETELQIGTRLVLNHNGTVHAQDVVWTNLSGDTDTSLQVVLADSKDAVIAHARTTHGFMMVGMEIRGWGMGWDEEGESVALCRNHIAAVTQIDRNV